MNTTDNTQPNVLYLLGCLSNKLDTDTRLEHGTAEICRCCVQSIRYILEPVPHRKLNPDFQPESSYNQYLKHLSKSIRRNKCLSSANYQNLTLLMQTLQTELWRYK